MEYQKAFMRVVSDIREQNAMTFPVLTMALLIYIHCKPYAKKGGMFFDPCAGWGGRMLGAYMLGMKYVAIDANRVLVDELNALAEYMKYDVEIVYGDSSDRDCVMDLMAGRKADLSFTCPPYWNEEHYSDDPFQWYNSGSPSHEEDFHWIHSR